jgi:hypothetical protein
MHLKSVFYVFPKKANVRDYVVPAEDEKTGGINY